jgi:hypothetical protein
MIHNADLHEFEVWLQKERAERYQNQMAEMLDRKVCAQAPVPNPNIPPAAMPTQSVPVGNGLYATFTHNSPPSASQEDHHAVDKYNPHTANNYLEVLVRASSAYNWKVKILNAFYKNETTWGVYVESTTGEVLHGEGADLGRAVWNIRSGIDALRNAELDKRGA